MPEESRFSKRIEKKQIENDTLLVVGLDSDFTKIPEIFKEEELPQYAFNKAVIDVTKDLVCAYKIQMAFYEERGLEGYRSLLKTLSYIAGKVPLIGDGKRNDIGNTSRAYARAFYTTLGFDAVTLNPYLGFESIAPFLYEKEKAVFVLVRTSNPGSSFLQNVLVKEQNSKKGKPFYLHLTTHFLENYHKLKKKAEKEGLEIAELGFVAGATHPKELKELRKVVEEETLILIPGIGAQGGDLKHSVKYGTNRVGRGVLINSSRGIIFPDEKNKKEKDIELIQERIRNASKSLKNEINKFR